MAEILPELLQAYLSLLTEKEKSPAFVQISKDGTILDFGGNLGNYNISGMEVGSYFGEQLVHLEGFLPVFDEPMILPSMMFEDGTYLDLHLLPGDDADFVLMIDATAEVKQRQLLQQKANELALLRTKASKLLDGEIGTGAAGELGVDVEGERKEVAILFANLRGFTQFSEQNDPKLVFKTLNSHLRLIVKMITEEAGFVDHIIGDTVTATFGLLPAKDTPVNQSVRSAMRILYEFRRLQGGGSESAEGLGIGISSGAVSYGMLGTESKRAFSAIGHRVNMAARLESQAWAGEILLDDNTFAALAGDLQGDFEEVTLDFRGAADAVTAYSCKQAKVQDWARWDL